MASDFAGPLSNVLATCLALLLSVFSVLPVPGPRQPIKHGRCYKAAGRIDGRAIDQGIACTLMLAALVVTYIYH